MIGIAITALALLAHAAPMSPSTVLLPATPAIGLPHLPKPKLPKLRMPHLPKRGNGGDPMNASSLRLKALVGEQEAWYADHGTYSTNATKIARNATRADASMQTVQVQVLFASKKGWTAMASHPDAPGKSCVVYVGYRTSLPMIPRTRADAVEAAQEGKAACDN
jgi:hypothetical protein